MPEVLDLIIPGRRPSMPLGVTDKRPSPEYLSDTSLWLWAGPVICCVSASGVRATGYICGPYGANGSFCILGSPVADGMLWANDDWHAHGVRRAASASVLVLICMSAR